MSNEIKNFYNLEAWKKSHRLVIEIYKISKNFPKEEQFGLISQLRRAAVSITANIAEGFERYHFNDKVRFYYQARGSIGEVHNLLILAKSLGFIDNKKYGKLEKQVNEVRRLINGLIRSIEKQKG
jgi:four helix bundle protein